jgi:hypothetical protein
MLRARAEAAGLDGTRITAQSLRAGHATAAALAGVPLNRIAAQTRHKDLSVLVNRYIRPLEALATTSAATWLPDFPRGSDGLLVRLGQGGVNVNGDAERTAGWCRGVHRPRE